MQFEIKTIIDFGDDGPPADKMNDILRHAVNRIDVDVVASIAYFFDLKVEATTHTGWTSSGDDEE